MQPPVVLPCPPPTDLGLQAMPNLKKMRTDHELEEGEMAPQKDNKQTKKNSQGLQGKEGYIRGQ